MPSYAPRAGRRLLAITLVVLAGCSDEEPSPSAPRSALKPHANVGDLITVTNTSGGSDVGSLRWALSQTTGGETIRFDPSLGGATIVLNGTAQVPHLVLIDGPADKGITISGGGKVPVMYVDEGARLRNVSVVGGASVVGDPAGIWSKGPLTLENSTVSDNQSDYGGIFAMGDATLINSTVGRNTGVVTSGIAYVGKLTLINSTVAYNGPSAGVRALLITPDATPSLLLRNSIISNNGSPLDNCYNLRAVTYEGRNLSNDTTCGDTTVMRVGNAALLDLANNGGPTATFAFPGTSAAFNAGLDCSVTVDQRYVARDAKCDIGAYEFDKYAKLTLPVDPTLYVNPNDGSVVVTGTVKCSAPAAFDIAVELKQDQKAGRAPTVVQAAGSTSANCTATAPWTIKLTPPTGGFQNGTGVVTAQTTKTTDWMVPTTTSAAVKLVWDRK